MPGAHKKRTGPPGSVLKNVTIPVMILAAS
jgi:hypothetical protein